ncbi:carbon starvation CstA family protein [Opitutus terrae]|uniref:Carbon starvation protein CstA n=1 Tax=Opitutus terrae (strain DSM 11246 / JCM 15787 / PB90-1) TaxID=452637 RepID=B1ZS08_OPITP|nr:carbon starvation CstA family protein [Opitutus terrae]ACB74684.1 carbon starvation protein CstA [Opitutus terrae PB90-1]
MSTVPASVRPWTPWRLLGWAAVALLGAGSIGILAWSRGEPVNALWMVVASVCVFAIAYRFHSAWLMAKVLTLDELRATPAVVHEDGKDFVQTNRWVVFGHHFAAIAGPGPLVGPVLAAQFGFLPGMLWILIGATLGGAVHDSVILFCSVRRGGRSLGQIVSDEVGRFAGVVALLSIVAIMVILIAVLALVVVNALAESPWGLFTIAATMPIAVIMGCAMRYGPHGGRWLGWVSAFGVVALLGSVYCGQFMNQWGWAEALTLKGTTLAWWIIGYGVLASILPVWLLLAPRDYLSTFMKIGTVAALGVAIVLLAPVLKMPALTRFVDGTGPVFAGPVFPFCFITIACAAVSGFHSLIASGTTPKLLTRESDIRVIGYGAMITEMLVGIMALIAACTMEPGQYFAINMKGEAAAVTAQITQLGFPVTPADMAALADEVGEKTMIGRAGGAPTFAAGMAHMFAGVLGGKTALALWYHFAIMFEALFILTTIDAGTRVGRFIVQDLLGHVSKPLSNTRSVGGSTLATLLFVGAWGWFLYQGVIDPLGGINSLWPIFGVANQLLAVIALALGTTVLIKMGRTRYVWCTLAPLAWLLAVTMSAGWMKIFGANPRLGFLSAARDLAAKIASGGTPAQLAQWERLLFNNYVNTAITATFLVLVAIVVIANARVWWQLLSGRRAADLHEEKYVAVRVAESPELSV